MRTFGLHILLISFVLSTVFLLGVSPEITHAKKPAVEKQAKNQKFIVVPVLRNDKKALNIFFGNVHVAQTIQYLVTYESNGSKRGIVGEVTPGQQSTITEEVIFGTCSGVHCVYDTNITKLKLEVTAQLLSGKNYKKTFKIKI